MSARLTTSIGLMYWYDNQLDYESLDISLDEIGPDDLGIDMTSNRKGGRRTTIRSRMSVGDLRRLARTMLEFADNVSGSSASDRSGREAGPEGTEPTQSAVTEGQAPKSQDP